MIYFPNFSTNLLQQPPYVPHHWIFVYPMFSLTFCTQIAQVHRAKLIDGQEVVVKVQHEGIKRVILEVPKYLNIASSFNILL